ncbi:ArsR/SmtB family transcription factor [Sandarakinorhabdus sp. DWP1-3-1]|uniref:ArsR/SmtB family transcription factor n=1 Tax=Sandarakinorhabdus sp. DWP1-3-1 TaxID=2804627 RepID=UPI003CF03224
METNHDLAVDRLAALAQSHRLAVFRLLVVAGPDGRAAGDIAADLGLPPSSLSFHLAHLKRVGLVRAERRGRSLCYAADFTAMHGLVDFLTENCCSGGACAPAETRSAA